MKGCVEKKSNDSDDDDNDVEPARVSNLKSSMARSQAAQPTATNKRRECTLQPHSSRWLLPHPSVSALFPRLPALAPPIGSAQNHKSERPPFYRAKNRPSCVHDS